MSTTPQQATFYMRGGHEITLGNLKNVEMNRDTSIGSYSGYTLEWIDGAKAPRMFSLSIPDIVAVIVVDDPYAPKSESKSE